MQRPCPETNVLREGKQSMCETAGSHRAEVGYQIFYQIFFFPALMEWKKQRGLEEAGALLHTLLEQTEALRLPLDQP